MAPLPPNSTARMFVEYTTGLSGAGAHTMQFRYLGTDRTAAAPQARLLSMLQGAAAGNFRANWKVTAVKTALAGEDFTVPQTPIAGLASFAGTNAGVYARKLEAREWVFVGRGVNSSRKVRHSIFGIGANVADLESFRGVVGAGTTPAWVGGWYAALTAANSPFVTIAGLPMVWYAYVNMNYNGYWERRLRTS